ncbi:MAG: transporter substrate-binding domain-containing protein [Pseudomonadota bacterium]
MKTIIGRAVVATIFALASLVPGMAAAELPVLVLNDTNDAPYTAPDSSGFLDAVAGEAFRRAGVTLRLVKLPAERALVNANLGIGDGDLTRIAGLETQYPNLVRVPEKLVDYTFAAFSKGATIPARWETIRTRPVGHIKGWKIYEQQLAGAAHILETEDAGQLFRMLERDRVDVALYERWLGAALVRQQGIQGVRAIEPPLAKREMFIYLHKRHAALVPKLAAALKAIKAEGLYQRLYKEKVLSFMDSPTK